MSDDNGQYKNVTGTNMLHLDNKIKKINSKERFTQRVKIGSGGQADAYKVYDSHLKIYRSMKIMKSQFVTNKKFVKLYKREVNITSQLNYPNIVKVYDAGTEDNQLFIIMDYVDGKSLNKIENLPESIAAMVVSRVAEALDYAHNAVVSYEGQTIHGIIHRDIKPGNLMVNKDGEIMIMDFGLSKAIAPISESTSGNVYGTLAYISPEQIDNKEVDHRSDLYSLGVTLYKLISGKTHFENNSYTEILKKKSLYSYKELINQSELSPELFKIISKATELNKEDRYESSQEFKDDLDKFIKENYDITAKYKNVLGAFFNFGIEPKKIEETTIEGKREKIDDKGRCNKKLSRIKYYFLIPIIVLVAALLIKIIYKPPVSPPEFVPTEYILTIKNTQKIHGEVYINNKKIGNLNKKKQVEFQVEKEGKYDISIKSKNRKEFEKIITFSMRDNRQEVYYNPLFPEVSEEVKEPTIPKVKKKKPKPKPTPFKYILTIKNPQKLDGQVYLDGKLIGELSKKEFNYDLKREGEYNILIKNPVRGDKEKNITFTKKLNEKEFTYNPPIYVVEIANIKNIDADVYIDDALKGGVEYNNRFVYYKPKTFELKIKSKSDKYLSQKWQINLNDNNLKITIDYDPSLDLKYEVVISNPDNIKAKIVVNNTDEFDFHNKYQKSYAEGITRNYHITAEGYQDETYVADFSKKLFWTFEYKPKPEIVSLIIKNTPSGGEIFLDGQQSSYLTIKDETIIPDLEFGKTYNLVIKKYPEYKKFDKEIKIEKRDMVITYDAPPETGTIRFNPPLDDKLLKYTKIWLDDNQIESKTEITNISPGEHNLRLHFKLNEYSQPISKDVIVEPLGDDDSNLTNVELNVDFVEIKCNVFPTKVFIDGKYVGLAPLIIPYMNRSYSKVIVQSEGRTKQEKSINPKEERRAIFTYTNEEAENYYIEAKNQIIMYKNYDSQNMDLLTEAQSNLQTAIELDKTYSEAYSSLLFIFIEKLKNAIEKDKKNIAEVIIAKAENTKNKALEYFDNPLSASIIYKNVGKGHYEFAINFLSKSEQVNYLRTKCLTNLEESAKFRKQISSTASLKLTENRDLDEADCYLAMCYQIIYELNGDEMYKNKAKTAWQSNYFNDYPKGAKVIPNPFREIKKEWYKRLMH